MATDFRKRRIERGMTRVAVPEKSGVALANITRFEQKGLISLKNLILLAIAMDYLPEMQSIFAEPKYTTMDELLQIRRNCQLQSWQIYLKNKSAQPFFRSEVIVMSCEEHQKL